MKSKWSNLVKFLDGLDASDLSDFDYSARKVAIESDGTIEEATATAHEILSAHGLREWPNYLSNDKTEVRAEELLSNFVDVRAAAVENWYWYKKNS